MTNLCQSCRQIPAVPGIRWCFECAEDVHAEIAAANDRPQYTGDICTWCGDNLTVADARSSSPNCCAKCRRQADRDEAKHLPHSLAEWLRDADAREICGAIRL